MRYQSGRPKRQFLAGVKCPNCGDIDTIVQVEIFEPNPDEYIECIACGHNERRPSASDIKAIQGQSKGGFDDGLDTNVGVVRFR